MEIVRLSISEKKKDAFILELDDGAAMTVTAAHVADFSLYRGRTLTDGEYDALVKAVKTSASKKRALNMLGSRNMSRHEITERLERKGEDAETASETADWLERQGLLNDADFAAMLVRHYAAKGYGAGRVKDELYKRGVDRALWDDALAQMPDTGEAVYQRLTAKLRGKNTDRKALKSAADALYRRGFAWDEIRPAIDRYLSEIKDLSDED
ncbi:regulatory protein RecX [Oscillospiraceae bacterium CM]|nr:regulatory protein RecX [Oscillospiraceae bacterium CM]